MNTVNRIMEALMAAPTPNIPSEFTEDQIGYSKHHFLGLLQTRLADEPDAAAMVERFLEAPDIWESQLVDALVRNGLDKDAEVIEAATDVLRYTELLDPNSVANERPEAIEPPSSIVGILEDVEDVEDS